MARTVEYTKDCGEDNGKSIDLSFTYRGDEIHYNNRCENIQTIIYYTDVRPSGKFAFDADSKTKSHSTVDLAAEEGGITKVKVQPYEPPSAPA